MSDFDADLYGDLYGNDEDFSVKTEEEKVPLKEKTTSESAAVSAISAAPASSTPSTNAPVAAIDKSTPTPAATSGSYQASSSAKTETAPPSTQQIPTYDSETSNQQNYMAGHGAGAVADFHRMGVPERSIRPSEMKDEGKMFIGGLNWETTDEGLRNYFAQFGKVDACTIMRDPAGRSRCFAFLTFEDPASVNAVMVREHYLDGKIIDPKRAIPRQEHQRATKLFIGGLAGTVTSESMREFFSQFGKVVDSNVMLDKETGRSKGFGFVSLEDTNVQPFLGFGNLEIDGKLIDVKLAEPRYRRDHFQEDQQNDRNQGAYNQGAFAGNQAAATGNTPFDPQALAQLYTRMFQMAGGMGSMGAMNPAMMGGAMNPAMMGGAAAAAGAGGMRPNMGMMGGGQGQGMMPNAMGGGMGRGGMPPQQQNLPPNIPRGPRGAPTAPAAMGVGPQRAGQRGQHNYHPYAR